MMRNIKSVLVCLFASVLMISCLKDEETYDYVAWKDANEAFFTKMKDSINPETKEKVYKEIVSEAYPKYSILYKVLEESTSEDKRKPLFTSTVTVNYSGHLYNTTENFDSGTTTGKAGTSYIAGWGIALQEMTVGEKWEVIIPWELAYGASGQGSIPPFSTLVFDMKLTKIDKYEAGTN